MRTLGVLRTTPGTTYTPDTGSLAQNEYGGRVERYARLDGRHLNNDGFHDAIVVEGFAYRIHEDSIGWLLTVVGNRPHLYLVDANRQPVHTLELAHTTLYLQHGHEYVVEQDDTGAWRVLETADVTSA